MATSQPPEASAPLSGDDYLGQVVAFTIADHDIDLDDLRAALTASGLRSFSVKQRIRRIDAFKRATNEIATKFTRHDDHQNSLSVKQVGQDAQESHRLVLLQRVVFKVGQQRRVEHETIWRIMYDRGKRAPDGSVMDDSIGVEQQVVPGLRLALEESKWIGQKIGDDGAALKARFEHHAKHLDSHGVRTFVREYLQELGATNVKDSGGLYFVPQEHLDELVQLALVVREAGSSIHLIPMLDIPDLRDMVEEAFTHDVHLEIRGYGTEITKITDSPNRRVLESTYDGYVGRADSIQGKVTEYEILLGRALPQANDELSAYRIKAGTLADRVRNPKIIDRRNN